MPMVERLIYRKPARLVSEQKLKDPKDPQPISVLGTRGSALSAFAEGQAK